jgi:hypothetical protein
MDQLARIGGPAWFKLGDRGHWDENRCGQPAVLPAPAVLERIGKCGELGLREDRMAGLPCPSTV